ncbi:hypothetical protein Tco_0331334 [Tanacetum coccineum]
MIESILHDKEIRQGINAKKLQKQGKVDMLKALVDSSIYTESSRTILGIHMLAAVQSDGVDIRPTYDTDSLEQVENDDYNVFTLEKEHPEQPEYANDTYLVEQGDTNTTHDSSNMSNNRGEAE